MSVMQSVRRALGWSDGGGRPQSTAPEPEPVYAQARPMEDILSKLTDEQKARLRAHKRPENFGCPSLPKVRAN